MIHPYYLILSYPHHHPTIITHFVPRTLIIPNLHTLRDSEIRSYDRTIVNTNDEVRALGIMSLKLQLTGNEMR